MPRRESAQPNMEAHRDGNRAGRAHVGRLPAGGPVELRVENLSKTYANGNASPSMR